MSRTLRAQFIIASGSHGMPAYVLLLLVFSSLYCGTLSSLKSRTLFHCEVCGIDFKKQLEYERHLVGRRHAENMVTFVPSSEIWNQFQRCHWSEGCSLDDVAAMWRDEELDTLGLKYRVNCLHPTPTVGKLNPHQRARVWRYIRDCMGPYYTELGNILAAADLDDEGHVRVKELFESVEAFKVTSRFILAANRTRNTCNQSPIQNVVELAGGHGLLSVLLAYRFPQLNVSCYDLLQRPTFEAFIRSFENHGIPRPGNDRVVPNIKFHEKDIQCSVDEINGQTIVVCLHGCGEINEIAVNIAIDRNAGWIVMPCCIKKGQYLHESCNVLLDDDLRYQMLCGALANEFDAQVLVSIDKRITNRPIFIAGGIYNDDEDPTVDSMSTQKGSCRSGSLGRALKTKNLPRLQYH